MARMTHESAKEFEVQAGNDIFSLADDGDSDRVQFMMTTMDDVMAYTTHSVPMTARSGKKYDRKVGCLRMYKSDPEGTCPLCDAGMPIKVARYIPLYSHTNKKAMLWERGPQFIDRTLSGYVNRLIANGKTPKQSVTEVVRMGKKGDTSTTYQLYPMDTITPHDLTNTDMPDPEGFMIATWSKDDMMHYVNTGEVPQTNTASDADVRRRPAPAASDYAQPSYDNNQFQAPQFNDTQVSDPSDLF